MSQVIGGRSLRRWIGSRVNSTVHGGDLRLQRYREPPGDPGLFGPDTVVWRVHCDIPGMFTGGLAALLLQSLHPLAIAGVDQHSDFRQNPIDRLNRTAGFVSVTSYGSTEAAEAALSRVRRVHEYVRGTAPDGRPYSAADPELLTWVHVAETSCFLAGYQVFGRGRLTAAEQDRYFAEVAVVAERLGATDVPASTAEVRRYFAAVRGELAATEAALAAVEFLRGFGPTPGQRAAVRVLMNGAVSLLPPWAAQTLRVRRPRPVQELVDRPAVHALGAVMRYGCEPSAIVGAARARVAAPRAEPGRAPAGNPVPMNGS
ncbi:oxygenase MpaB family protein [Streptacidiphilus sp. N1-12]|uniref:Oxygenase MpaB family protein n=2 Tax=Streptacidiphilus alkalitolerans TaxID=3342712 RepID=A0ABV6WMM2_9ACTN